MRQGAAWRDLDSLQRETLSRVLAERGVSLPATARESLVRGWRQLRAWPDSREGLERLRRTHAVPVQGTRDQFFAGAGFAGDQYGDVRL